MSIDIEEMAAHLDKQRRNEVKEQYNQRHTHATTAFLLCFFLGFLGAHRFYLGQWRSGLAHLALFVLGAAGVITGFLTTAPVNAALFVIGGVLILASLIWEIVDLGRIDNEIHKRNLLLAEGLIAGVLLADPTAIEDAVSKLDEAVHTAAAQSRAAGVAHDTSAFAAGMISAEDLAQARALAEESGQASISYHELANFTVSATPEEHTGNAPVFEPATITERHVSTEPLPANPDTAPVIEAQTHAHSEDGFRVTEAEETNRVSGPSAAEAIGLGAAMLGAAGEGLHMAETPREHDTPTSAPASEATLEPQAEPAPEPVITQNSESLISEPQTAATVGEISQQTDASSYSPPAEPVAPIQPEGFSETETPSYSVPTESLAPAELAAQTEPVIPEEPAPVIPEEPVTPTTPATLQFGGDVTDAGMPEFFEPAADIAFASSYPGYITLPEESAPTQAFTTGEDSKDTMEPLTQASAGGAGVEPAIPLYITPEETAEETAPTYIPPATPEPSVESYVPPVPDVYSASAPHPELYKPSWEMQAPAVTPEPKPDTPTHKPNSFAELADLGAVAGVGALAADALSHHSSSPAPEPTAAEPSAIEPGVAEPTTIEPASSAEPQLTSEPAATNPLDAEPAAEPAEPKMKRIRVKHRIVVEGQVVREEVVEREVPADMDMALAARQIQAELEQASAATPDEIARLANLSADDELEVRRHIEGLSQ